MKKVLVACGNGVATSTVVGRKIQEACEEAGIAVNISQCKLMEVESKADNFDLVVSTGKFEGNIKVPIVNGISILTGIGSDDTIQKIINYLK